MGIRTYELAAKKSNGSRDAAAPSGRRQELLVDAGNSTTATPEGIATGGLHHRNGIVSCEKTIQNPSKASW
jgi:hypothetical protein